MKFIWLLFFIEFVLGAVIKVVFGYQSSVGIVLFLIHMTLTLGYLMSYSYNMKFILIAGFIIRICGLLYDVYFDVPFLMLNSSTDAEAFYEAGRGYYNDTSLIFTDFYRRGGLYGKFLGIWFFLQGPSRLWAQYLNTVCGLSVLLMLIKTMNLINITRKTQLIIVTIAAFFFQSVMKSSTLQREMLPTFFVVCSLYFFIMWLKYSGFNNWVLVWLSLLAASFFHAGVLGVSVGYIFGFALYDKKAKKAKFKSRSLAMISIIIICGFFIATYAGNIFMRKFEGNDFDSIAEKASREGRGGAAYNVGINVNTPIGLVFGGILRAVYFISSPTPWYWRGLSDISSFFLDAIVYIVTLFLVFKRRKVLFKDENWAMCIIFITLCIIGGTFVFGIGVSNAGPAMRHRQKLISLFLILLAFALDAKKNKTSKLSFMNK